MRAASGVIAVLGMAVLGVLAFGIRKLMLLERPVDAGDLVVLGVLAVFGVFCLVVGWLLWDGTPPPQVAPPVPAARRITVSHACSTAGVALLIASVLVPAHWHPVVLLFAGIALLAVAHVLTPCEERLEKLRKARASLRQL